MRQAQDIVSFQFRHLHASKLLTARLPTHQLTIAPIKGHTYALPTVGCPNLLVPVCQRDLSAHIHRASPLPLAQIRFHPCQREVCAFLGLHRRPTRFGHLRKGNQERPSRTASVARGQAFPSIGTCLLGGGLYLAQISIHRALQHVACQVCWVRSTIALSVGR